MNGFYNKDEYQYDDILEIINNEVEESIFLDFKSSAALSKSDNSKKEIAKDVSAFANSEGGIIIYGIDEENHKAKSISYIDGNEYTKEWLEHVINSNIQRRLSDLRIIPLREQGDIEKTIYLVKIPKSKMAPHMSKDKRYYKRFNFESVMMEEYEVRALFMQKSTSELEIASWDCRKTNTDEEEMLRYICEVDVFNSGDVSEESFKVNTIISNFPKTMKLQWDSIQYKYQHTAMGNGVVKLSSQSSCPIYPQEYLNGFRANFEIPKIYENDLKDVEIRIDLLYSSGSDKVSTKMLIPWFKLNEDL